MSERGAIYSTKVEEYEQENGPLLDPERQLLEFITQPVADRPTRMDAFTDNFLLFHATHDRKSAMYLFYDDQLDTPHPNILHESQSDLRIAEAKIAQLQIEITRKKCTVRNYHESTLTIETLISNTYKQRFKKIKEARDKNPECAIKEPVNFEVAHTTLFYLYNIAYLASEINGVE